MQTTFASRTPTTRRRRRRVCSPPAWLLLLCLCARCTTALAGDAGAEPELKPADSGAIELSLEALQARAKQIQEAKDLDEAVKKKLLELYEAAIAQVQAADEWSAKAAAFEKARQDAPGLLESIRAELSKPLSEPKPDAPAKASASQLEQYLGAAAAEVAAARKAQDELKTEAEHRAARRLEVPKLLPAAKQRLEEVAEQLKAAAVAGEAPEVALGRRTLLLARKKAIQQEIEAYEKEIGSYDTRAELLNARQERAARKLGQAQKLEQAWRELVNERRRAEAERNARLAREAQRDAARAHPSVKAIAETNAQLAERRVGTEGLAARIEMVANALQQANQLLTKLRDDRRSMMQKIEAGGVTQAMALLLRAERENLPDVRRYRKGLGAREAALAVVHLELLDRREQRSALSDIEPKVQALLDDRPASVTAPQRADIETAAQELLKAQRSLLEALVSDTQTYFNKLGELDIAERQLITEAERYADYINERILWMRSTAALRPSDVPRAWEAVRWLLSPTRWAGVVRVVGIDVRRNWSLYALPALVFLALFLRRRWFRERLATLGDSVARAETDRLHHTFVALAITVLISVPGPGLLWFGGWRLRSADAASEFTKAIAAGVTTFASLFFVVTILRNLCTPEGLGRSHFRWRDEALPLARRHLRSLAVMALPVLSLVSIAESQASEARKDSLGRLAFIIGMVALSWVAQRILRPSGKVMEGVVTRHRSGWLERSQYGWFLLVLLVPLALAVIAVLGYYYAALELEGRLRTTLLVLLCAAVVHEIAVRCIFFTRRRLAIRRFQERRAAEQATAAQTGDAPDQPEPSMPATPSAELYSMSLQTHRMLDGFLGVALVIAIWVTWSDVLPALGIVKQVKLWSTTVQQAETVDRADGTAGVQTIEKLVYITLADVALAIITVVLTLVAVRNIPGLLEFAVLHRLPLDRGVSFAITNILRYLIMVVGFVLAFGMLGIGWAKVQWLVAAMTVGLGFGLQEIFANFVSGLIILFERPMRVGDTVTIGDITGTVSKIRIRATTITSWDRKELVVPNKEFVTGQLINWTLSDSVLRMIFPVGIAYGSNTDLAEQVLLRVAVDHPMVLDDPAPYVLFKGFGDSALEFELRVYIPGMDSYIKVWHDVNKAIDNGFRKAGIEIAFPQRDLHVRSVKATFPFIEKPE